MPAPPPMFSTTTLWPRISPIAWACSRAEMSTPPPGVNGTTRVMVRVGHSWAAHGDSAAPVESAAARIRPKAVRDIAVSIGLLRMRADAAVTLLLQHGSAEY